MSDEYPFQREHMSRLWAVYVKSPHVPHHCMLCTSSVFTLMRRNAKRKGNEGLGDVLPLCLVHEYAVEDLGELPLDEAVANVGGWSTEEANRRLRPFNRLRDEAESEEET